jgi:CheY-like chemotaxis protein
VETAPPILLVEDNEDDAFFILKAFESLGLPVTIQHCRNGQEAIDYLEPQALFPEERENDLPQLIVLDLKMPGKSGFDVLDWIQNHKHSLSIVVIILTSSTSQRDIERADKFKVNAYLIKPIGLKDTVEVARCICHLWFNHIPQPLQERLFEPAF